MSEPEPKRTILPPQDSDEVRMRLRSEGLSLDNISKTEVEGISPIMGSPIPKMVQNITSRLRSKS